LRTEENVAKDRRLLDGEMLAGNAIIRIVR
jgi:hypothetical protein